MNGNSETKSEIRARIEELEGFLHMIHQSDVDTYRNAFLVTSVEDRLKKCRESLETAEEDLSSSILKSHKALCAAKQMGEKEAYGNDPAVYYTLGVCGEAGEMANAIVKAQRNGNDRDKVIEAVKSELPDVIIYSYILAHVLDLDLSSLVNEKSAVVVQRALDGYYGAPLKR